MRHSPLNAALCTLWSYSVETIKIKTQGVSEDYETATGDFELLDRGEVTHSNLRDILDKLSRLSVPDGDDVCEPSINVDVEGEGNLNFYGDSGVIRCLDSQQESMSSQEALQIILGEVTLAEFDAKHGYMPKRNNYKFIAISIVFLVVIASLVLART